MRVQLKLMEIKMSRTAKEIVDQTHDLAEKFYEGMGYKHIHAEHGNLYESQHPTEILVWKMACWAQIELTDTDPEDALSELDMEQYDE